MPKKSKPISRESPESGLGVLTRLLPEFPAVAPPLAVLDDAGTVLSANQAFYDVLGVSADQGAGRDLLALARGQWDELELLPRALRENVEAALLLPDGDARVVGLSAVRRPSPRLKKGNGAATTLLVIEDLTERRRAEQKLDRLVSLLSHELRAPLAAMLLHVELLRACQADPEKVARVIDAVERSARAQAQLVDDLLDASRIAAGKLEMDRRALDLARLVREALALVSENADRRPMALEVSIPASAGQVLGDAARLRHALWHVLANAVKFTPKGGRVTVTLERVSPDRMRLDGEAQLRVRDSGIGIAPNGLARVFEPFEQLDRGSSYGGLGLGLAIARHVVEQHGGSIEVESGGEGRGATFTITLPLAHAEDIEAGEIPGTDRLHDVRVLVVEDHDDTREATTELLEARGAVVCAVASVEAARSLFAKFQPHALVCDILLPPGDDGYSLVRWVRAEAPGALRDIPAIALTALNTAQDRQRAIAAGFDEHFVKPANGELLTKALFALLERGVRA